MHYSYNFIPSLNWQKSKHRFTTLLSRVRTLAERTNLSTTLNTNLNTTFSKMEPRHTIHPSFHKYIHNMLKHSLRLIGPRMSPYRYNAASPDLQKIKSLLLSSLELTDNVDITPQIIRLPFLVTQTHHRQLYNGFLRTISWYSLQHQIKIVSVLDNYLNSNKPLYYKTVVKHLRPFLRRKKPLKPYMFLRTFRPKNFYKNKTILHKFFKIIKLTRFAKRRRKRHSSRKKLLVTNTKRIWKCVASLVIKSWYNHHLLNSLSVQIQPRGRRRISRWVNPRRRKKRRRYLFKFKKYMARFRYLGEHLNNHLWNFHKKTGFFWIKRRRRGRKRKRAIRMLKVLRWQKKIYLYNVNTVKLRYKRKRILSYWRGTLTRPTRKYRRLISFIPCKNLTRALLTALQTFLDRTLNKSCIYGKACSPKIKIFTKTKKAFMLRNVGVFILSNLRLFSLQYKFKFRYKKSYFSFLFPNQLKKSLMDKKRRIMISRFFVKRKFKTSKQRKFSLRTFKKRFKSFYRLKLLNAQESGKPNSTIHFFKKSVYDMLYSSDYVSKGVDFSAKSQEVFIRRIRFKPGYQRIWRQARTSIKEALSLKFLFQYRLTRFLMKFFRQTTHYMLSFTEISLEKTLMYSRLLPDVHALNSFIESNLVYLNGFCTHWTHAPVTKNDLIQLVISNWYYALYRWLLNWAIIRIKKFKRLVYKKGLAGKHRLMKTRKQKSRYTPNWIHNVRYDMSDVKNYLEVDYFTLSVFVVYEPFILNHQFINDLPQTRPNIFKLYNWKYIT